MYFKTSTLYKTTFKKTTFKKILTHLINQKMSKLQKPEITRQKTCVDTFDDLKEVYF